MGKPDGSGSHALPTTPLAVTANSGLSDVVPSATVLPHGSVGKSCTSVVATAPGDGSLFPRTSLLPSDSDSDSEWSTTSSSSEARVTSHPPARPVVSFQSPGAVPLATSTPQVRPSASTAASAGSVMKLPIQLPKLSSPTMDGDLLAWPDFWDMFSCAVDSQAIPEVSKLTYLKSVLHGRASRLICGLAVTGVNYPIAVAALKAEFARPELIDIQRRFAVSHFLRSSGFFVVEVAGQIPATTSTGFCFTACLEQAISRLQATPLSKKFEISMVEGILRREFQNVWLAAQSFNLHHSNFAGWFWPIC